MLSRLSSRLSPRLSPLGAADPGPVAAHRAPDRGPPPDPPGG
jgi:hypothetical protein